MRNAIQILILALIGLTCGGMFTVVIVQVREAANRSQCWNNIREFSLAVANYASSSNGTFPPAGESNPPFWFPPEGEVNPPLPHRIEPPEKRLSWFVVIFPYLEANPIYTKLSHDKTWDAEENRFAAVTDYLIFHCPGYPERLPASTLVPTHYLGITGIGAEAIALPLENPRAGIFGYDRKVTQKDLRSGTSETLLMIETSQAYGAWTAAGPPTARGLIPDGSPYIGVGGQFGGNHRRGANAGFADGSVRFLDQSINPAVWEAMATLSGKGNPE